MGELNLSNRQIDEAAAWAAAGTEGDRRRNYRLLIRALRKAAEARGSTGGRDEDEPEDEGRKAVGT